jgi:dTDP-4-dehydrorhamnose reductase
LNILVTGSNGQLGKEFRKLSTTSSFNFFFTDKTDLDIRKPKDISSFVETNNINLILNCAAYTAVDHAEDDKQNAYQINRDAVKNLVDACGKYDVSLIHFSTDYVFNGMHYKPYQESDETNPLGVYGASKRAGEEEVLKSEISALIIRTSWLYSAHGHNFYKTMLRLGKERDEISVVDDQIGTPTYAYDLAKASLVCVENVKNWHEKREIYHFSNEGVASWYDFTKAIFNSNGINCKVNPIPSEKFPTKSKRPFYSVLNKQKFKTDFSYNIRHWNDALKSLKN